VTFDSAVVVVGGGGGGGCRAGPRPWESLFLLKFGSLAFEKSGKIGLKISSHPGPRKS